MQASRRNFLSTALAAPAAMMATAAAAAPATPVGKPLKMCVFADLHYHPGGFVNDTPEFLEKIMARAEETGCDMMIHLGDFIHNVVQPKQKAFLKLYNDFKIPGYHILGNHDQDGNAYKLTCEAYRMPDGHYSFDKGGFRFVIADPNYFCNEPGKFIHHENGNYFRRVKGSTINWIPPEQLEWMRETIMNSPYPCIVLSHQSFERPPNGAGVLNKEEVQAIFNAANAKRPGQVRLVMNGHMHTDYLRVLDNILYWDVNSANYQWYGETHDKYPPEYMKARHHAKNNLGWDAPLSAIVTMWQNGRIKIEGSKANWLFGVTPRDAKLPLYDSNGRYTLPVIQSADMTFNYERT